MDKAIDQFKKAIELELTFAMAHNNLGAVLLSKHRREEGIAEIKKALNLDPNIVEAHNNLGVAMLESDQTDEAIIEFNKAVDLDPKSPMARNGLGAALGKKARYSEAIAQFNKVLALDPKNQQAQYGLRHFTLAKKTMLFLSPELALEPKLLDVLAGKAQPKDNAERLALIELCSLQERPAVAAKLYSDAFRADTKLAEDINAFHRYKAACFATLAAAGHDLVTDEARGELRTQALQWLRADLAAWGKLLDKDTAKGRPIVQRKIRSWKKDADLASVREFRALEKLPKGERDDWKKLWTDVDALLKKLDAPVPKKMSP